MKFLTTLLSQIELVACEVELELRWSDLLIMDLDRSEATHSVDTACSALLNVFI